MATTAVALPTFTDSVDQAWFIEPLNGPTPPRNYLDRFPEEVYNKSPDSHLVRLMYTLLGPAGIGWLKTNLLQARLVIDEFGVELFDIEKFYGNPFRFGRILDELYDEDPTGLLNRADWDLIKARDEQYRTRAIRFMQGVRLGNSPQGMSIISESGIGYPTDIVENYKYLFDSHSDRPLGLRYYGKTASINEFIVKPRSVTSHSEVQTITIGGNPTGGNFVLVFNGQQTTAFTYTPVTSTVSSITLPVAAITTTNTGGFPASGTITVGNQTVTYTSLNETTFLGCLGGVGVQPAGTLVTGPSTNYSSIPYNAPGSLVGAALRSLGNIGPTGVRVTGGPLPSPYTVQFGGSLTNQDVPEISAVNGLTGGTPTIDITTVTGGLDAATETVVIPSEHQHNLQAALDLIRSVPTIPTFFASPGLHSRQDWTAISASSQYSEVVRFVTGSLNVTWPATDSAHWIRAGVETQAPRIKDDRQHHYVGFHNVASATAYTDDALADINYEVNRTALSPYNSVHVGGYSPQIGRAIPFFRSQTDPFLVYSADKALADYAESLTVTTQQDNTGLVNGIYPTDYSKLAGVATIKYKDEQFWSSRERTSGAEILELDLGSPQAVNFLTFEAIRKPFDIEVAYDIYDQSPRRHFVPITPGALTPFETSLFYDPLEVNPWHYFEYHFGDANDEMIFTRFIRIKITRRSDQTFLFDALSQVQTPWSVEVRNLRIGRNVVDA